MSNVDLKPESVARAGGKGVAPSRANRRSRFRPLPMLLTLAAVALAGWLGWVTWQVYMASPWTRDGVVRAYVVSVAPEVSGRVVRLPVVDNQFVHKGDELFEIDPSDYRIALAQAQAQLERDQAALEYQRENERRQATLSSKGIVATETFQRVTSTLREAEAAIDADRAAIDKAQLDLSRTEVRARVNGYVTNLLLQLGDYATVGQTRLAVVDADSYWIDGYFEETALARIHPGDKATVKLMAYKPLVRGHVDSVARGINVPNAQPDQAGLASVNPIFTWVRLAQRVPVRIHVDEVPPGVRLVAGLTATIQIEEAKTAQDRSGR
jgi:multidrug resistance efflux pump